jgi:hypothetical protein
MIPACPQQTLAAIIRLQALFERQQALELGLLVGSQAQKQSHADSDWDIAVQWAKSCPPMQALGLSETLRREIADALRLPEAKIDLIDMPTARLAMRAVIAEQGILLKGDDTLAWSHFLQRTWRELEAYDWERRHAA